MLDIILIILGSLCLIDKASNCDVENCALSVIWSNNKPAYEMGGPGIIGRIHPNKPTMRHRLPNMISMMSSIIESD